MPRFILMTGLFFLISLTTQAQAISSTSGTTSGGTERVELKEVLGQKKFQENTEITDTKLKAESGSLSKYSLSFNLSYYGPTVGELDAKDQPNPDGTPGSYETAIGGSLGGRYRFSPNATVSAGTGMKAIHPFHGIERFDTNNPYLNLTFSDKISELQMRNSLGGSLITLPVYTKIAETYSLNYDTSVIYNFGKSGLALGFDGSISYFFYSRGYERKDGRAARYNISAYPTIKYNINDKLNVNTSVTFSSYNPRSRDEQSVLLNRTISQRLSAGYAFTRDIYLSPYLTFYPDDLAPDRTTVNMSAIFSVL